MNPITYVIINSAVIALIWIGGRQVYEGVITQGQVVALVSYMSQILIELIKLANLIITVTKAIACGNRIQAVFEIENSLDVMSQKQWDGETADFKISFENVGLTYPGNAEESLKDIDFSVSKGETVGVIGGTGSGKTSLVHLLPRFYDATRGKVLIDGRDVKEYPLKELRSKIAIVLQKSVLFSGTIRENLLWGKEDAGEEELWEALEISQSKEFVEKKEKGLETIISQGGKNLSGGQRQRLAIARALVKKPEILIMDDSASALDFATDAALRKAIREMKNPPVVFIVSQRAASVLQADKIIVLEDGGIAGMGTHEELLESCEVYQEIYFSQTAKANGKEG